MNAQVICCPRGGKHAPVLYTAAPGGAGDPDSRRTNCAAAAAATTSQTRQGDVK